MGPAAETRLDAVAGRDSKSGVPPEIFDRFKGPVWAVAMHAFGHHARADHVVARTFTTFRHSPGLLLATDDPGTVLFSTARRVVFELLTADSVDGRREAPSAAASWERWQRALPSADDPPSTAPAAHRARPPDPPGSEVDPTGPVPKGPGVVLTLAPGHRSPADLASITSDVPAGGSSGRPTAPPDPFATWTPPPVTNAAAAGAVPDEVLSGWPPPAAPDTVVSPSSSAPSPGPSSGRRASPG